MRAKLAAVSAGVVVIVAAAAAVALGAAEDRWAAGANHAWTAASGDIKFIVTRGLPHTVTCTMNTGGGSTVGSGPDIGALRMDAPEFAHCTDSFGGTDQVTTVASGWKVEFYWDKTSEYCPAGTGDDKPLHCLVIGVPKMAIAITINAFGCTQTIQSNGSTDIGTSVKAPGGTTKDTIALSNPSLTITGCGQPSGSVKLTGTYTLESPNHGVLVATS